MPHHTAVGEQWLCHFHGLVTCGDDSNANARDRDLCLLTGEPAQAWRGGRTGGAGRAWWSDRTPTSCTGHYVEEPCSSPHTRSECVACDTGTYMGHANGLRSCLLCTTCREGESRPLES